MKTFLLVTAILFCCFKVLGQKQEVTYLYYDSYIDSLKNFKLQNKFITSKLFSKDGKILQEIERKSTSEAKYREINYEYDPKGRITSKEWKSAVYISRTIAFNSRIKYEWTYNENDSILTYSFSKYSFSLQKFMIEYVHSNEYNNQNQLIRTTYSGAKDFASDNFEQVDYAQHLYFYDTKKQMTRSEYLDFSNNNKSIYEYLYDQDGKQIQSTYAYFRSDINTLTVDNQKSFTYDADGNLITILNSYLNLSVSPALIPYSKQTFIYDSQKREISTSIFQYLPQRNIFQAYDKTTSTYNDKGMLEERRKAYLPFNGGTSTFDKDSVTEIKTYEYYPDKKIKTETQFHTGINYVWGDRNRYEYQTTENTTEIGFNDSFIVYPNPASDKIIIENTLNDDCLESVALHDMLGKQILFLERTDMPICVWQIDLPPTLQSGVYLLYCKSFNGKTTGKKIVIQ